MDKPLEYTRQITEKQHSMKSERHDIETFTCKFFFNFLQKLEKNTEYHVGTSLKLNSTWK